MLSSKGSWKTIKTILAVLGVLIIFWTAFIFARSLKSAEDSTMESAFFLTLIRRFLPSVSMHLIRKLAHFTEFFLLGCLSCAFFLRAFRKQDIPARLGISISLVYCLAAAVTDELLQLSSPGRSCQVKDMLLDFSGSAAGILLYALAFVLIRRRKQE